MRHIEAGATMSERELIDIEAIANALTEQVNAIVGTQITLDDIVGQTYVKQLAAMSQTEAICYLHSSSGETLLNAYMIFTTHPEYALGVNHSEFAEVCLRFMASDRKLDRMIGAVDVGIWLAGSNDKTASRVLASIICNKKEKDVMRYKAYKSLQLINGRIALIEPALDNAQKSRSMNINMIHIDWVFVRSFL